MPGSAWLPCTGGSRPGGDLIAGAFEAKMAAYADAVTHALADPYPWAGFCSYIVRGMCDAGR